MNYEDCDILHIEDYSGCDVIYVTDVGGAYREDDYIKTEAAARDGKNRYSHVPEIMNSHEFEQREYPALDYMDASGMEFMDVIESVVHAKPDIGSLANEVFNLGGFYLRGQELHRMDGDIPCYDKVNEKTLRNTIRDLCVTSRIYENLYSVGKFSEVKDRIESLCRLWGLCISDDEYRCLQLEGFSNGVFDLKKMVFAEKNEHNYVRFPVFHAFKFPYVPIAERKGKIDGYKMFLSAISGNDEKLSRFIEELYAKVLVGRRNSKRLVWIIDPKGFLYELLKLLFDELLGTERVSTITLSKLKESKLFMLDSILVNLSCDAGLAELSTTDFPLSQILSSNIVTYNGSKKGSFSNGALFINITKIKPQIPPELKRVCIVFEMPCAFKESAECAFEKIKPELPYVVSHLIDTVYANMLKRDSAEPDENLIAKLIVATDVDTIQSSIDNCFSTGKYEVIIKEEAFDLYTEYTRANGYTAIGRNFFYAALLDKGLKQEKLMIVDKVAGRAVGKRTVFLGISHVSRTYALSPVEIEKIRAKRKGD